MKKGLVACVIMSILFVTSLELLSMDGKRNSIEKALEQITRFSPDGSPTGSQSGSHSSTPEDRSPSSSQPSSPSQMRLPDAEKEKRRARISKAFAHLAGQMAESDTALKGLQDLRRSSSSSSDEQTKIIAKNTGVVTITSNDGTAIANYQPTDDGVSQIPSEETLKFVYQQDTQRQQPNVVEETTPTKSLIDLNKQRQQEAKKPAPQLEKEELQRQEAENLALQQEKKELQKQEAARLTKEQEAEELAKLLQQQAEQKEIAENLSREQEKVLAQKETTAKLAQKSWYKEHPVFITVAGLSMSLITIFVLLYYFDKLPHYNPSHLSL